MDSQEEYKNYFKIMLLGDTASGKTSLCQRFIKNTWNEKYDPSVGIELKTKYFEVDQEKVRFQIYDTVGQDRFFDFSKFFYKSLFGVVFVYDITDINSFNRLNNWIEEMGKNVQYHVCKVLVGTKSDLDQKREVTYEQGKEFAEKSGMMFFETSSKNDQNVSDLFLTLTKENIKLRIKENEEADSLNKEK